MIGLRQTAGLSWPEEVIPTIPSRTVSGRTGPRRTLAWGVEPMRQMNLYLPRALMQEADVQATAAGKTLPLWIAEAVEAAVIRAQEEAR